MSDSAADSGSWVHGFDGRAVIDLDSLTIVSLNDAGAGAPGLGDTALPLRLDQALTATDFSVFVQRVIPQLRAGNEWRGALRVGTSVDTTPTPVVVVPHVTADAGYPAEFASLLFASDSIPYAPLVPDPLTGLATRSALISQLDHMVRNSRSSAATLAVLFIDLDGLKKVNDRYGHEVGDTVLFETAQRIVGCVSDDMLAVRFGGDEFVVLCDEVDAVDEVVELAEQIIAALQGTSSYHSISASIGIALNRAAEIESLEMIRRADSAMYRAKARGGAQIAIFDAEMRDRQRQDQQLRTRLLQAISNNGFGVAAQPIYELATGRIIAVELFIRVRNGAPLVESASDLFRLTHEYGEAFDAAVLGRALALAQLWQRAFGRDAPRVQVNVSAQSMAASQFVRRVGAAIRSDGIRPGALAFEVECRDFASAGERERSTLTGLRELGVPVVVDGYDGDALTLGDIAEWQPSMVKMNASDPPAVLTGLVRGVSALRVQPCLKGIGSRPQLDAAVRIGCYAGQGNALTPVRGVDRINTLLHTPNRLGF